jgi:hypothetical protein
MKSTTEDFNEGGGEMLNDFPAPPSPGRTTRFAADWSKF